MKKTIHHLRKQPEYIKKLILHLVVVVSGFILFSFWAMNLEKINISEIGKDIRDDFPQISELKNNFVDGYDNLK